jgi:hypothetical protein
MSGIAVSHADIRTPSAASTVGPRLASVSDSRWMECRTSRLGNPAFDKGTQY